MTHVGEDQLGMPVQNMAKLKWEKPLLVDLAHLSTEGPTPASTAETPIDDLGS